MQPGFTCWLMLGCVALAACSGDTTTVRQSSQGASAGSSASIDPSTPAAPVCTPARFCAGAAEITRTCNGTMRVETARDCAALGLSCQATIGCAVCQPKLQVCQGNDAMVCRADGSGYDLAKACDLKAGQICDTGICSDPCSAVESSQSYIGCEYWPTPVLNSQLDEEFEFAVIVANPQSVPATVTITLGERQLLSAEIAASGTRAIPLPWIPALKGKPGAEQSALVPRGAYRLKSNVPVTVYQFNPLEYRIDQDCASESMSGGDPMLAMDNECYSFSNDASLLLPTHVLAKDYIVVSRATMLNRRQTADLDRLSSSPGFFAVIGADPAGADVTLDLTAHVVASTDAMIAALAPGEQATFRLAQGDVLQVVSQAPDECLEGPAAPDLRGAAGSTMVSEIRSYCSVSRDYDLTGSEVHATGRVAVTSGHNCSFVPYGRWACDHQEEQLFPLQAWGKDYLVSVTKPLREEPNVIRIVSGADGNAVHFEPQVRPDLTLARGEMVEFETNADFRVTGTQALLVAQFLVGQDYAGILSAGPKGLGDPSLSLAIPIEQYRTQYSVLVPESYPLNLINVTIQEGTQVQLDGLPVLGFTPVPGTGMATARVEVSKGQHDLSSDAPFGVVSYGFGTYTSYMYPAGLDFKRINPLQ